ncbi:MAG: hypothetical protein IPG94_21510 [Kineosporiaceae bacterium]|nr:hypothetical protein [Kineosporiaceae bacterium]
MYSREFAHQLTASVEPDIPVGYRLDPDYTPSQGFRCQIENTVLTLSAGVNAGAAGASLLPVTRPIEVAALESPNIEPGQPIRFDLTVTAPTLHLAADPTSAAVTGDNKVAVTLTESTGFGLAPTAASNKASNARCTPGTVTRISPTQFTSTVATRGGDYTCTITWRMKSWLGGPRQRPPRRSPSGRPSSDRRRHRLRVVGREVLRARGVGRRDEPRLGRPAPAVPRPAACGLLAAQSTAD